MYSKQLLNRYISERTKQMDWTVNKLSQEMGMTQTNLSRALNQEQFNLTLPQFSRLCKLLDLTPEQIYHILTGMKKKEATLQLVKTGIEATLKSIN